MRLLSIILLMLALPAYAKPIVNLECFSGGKVIYNKDVDARQIRIYQNGLIEVHTKKHDTSIKADCIISY